MNRIVVYTALYGNKDTLKDPINYNRNSNIDLFCFTDNINLTSSYFKIIHVPPVFSDLSKNSKKVKIIGFDGILNYDVAIWHDASLQIDFNKMDELLKFSENTISAFRHPRRTCLYREAISCVIYRRDYNFRIILQIFLLMILGYPVNIGLTENTILVINVKKYFSSAIPQIWWRFVKNLSKRDQLSLCYALFKTKTKPGILEGNGFSNQYSVHTIHLYDNFIDKSILGKLNFKFGTTFSILMLRILRKMASLKNRANNYHI